MGLHFRPACFRDVRINWGRAKEPPPTPSGRLEKWNRVIIKLSEARKLLNGFMPVMCMTTVGSSVRDKCVFILGEC